jgi:tRNA1(Val) A37 N6-methylase TrmN6
MVDLQPESVEIAKLSLWLKTAKKDQKLNNLDQNVKCENSLKINWNEFFSLSGFDIILGNPPYIKEYNNKSAFDGLHKNPYYQGKMDLWTMFALII